MKRIGVKLQQRLANENRVNIRNLDVSENKNKMIRSDFEPPLAKS